MVKEIFCKNGEAVLVDDEDYAFLSKFTWYMGSELRGESGGYPCFFIYGQRNTRKQIFMHQLLVPGSVNVDHIDQNHMNNTKANLRAATWQENGWNKGPNKTARGKPRASKYKGVMLVRHKDKPTWLAQIRHVERGQPKETGKTIRLGYYDNEDDAARAYNAKVKELRGEWAWMNPVPEINHQSPSRESDNAK